MREPKLKFLETNPSMIDRAGLTSYAGFQASQEGYERGTPQHMTTTKEIFDKHLAQSKRRARRSRPDTSFDEATSARQNNSASMPQMTNYDLRQAAAILPRR